MKLLDGYYRTNAGSTMFVNRNGGRSVIEFDWLEEGGCIECEVDPYETIAGQDDEPNGMLIWHCDECGSHSAVLHRDKR